MEKKQPTPATSTYGYENQKNLGAMQGIDPNYSYVTGEFDNGDYNWKDIYKSFKDNYDPARKAVKKTREKGVSAEAPPVQDSEVGDPDQ